jgi:hypothetical protein
MVLAVDPDAVAINNAAVDRSMDLRETLDPNGGAT